MDAAPSFDGPLPNSMVVQLEVLPAADSTAPLDASDPPGDPVYGHVLNPAAVEGFTAEAEVIVHYHVIQRTYPDGTRLDPAPADITRRRSSTTDRWR